MIIIYFESHPAELGICAQGYGGTLICHRFPICKANSSFSGAWPRKNARQSNVSFSSYTQLLKPRFLWDLEDVRNFSCAPWQLWIVQSPKVSPRMQSVSNWRGKRLDFRCGVPGSGDSGDRRGVPGDFWGPLSVGIRNLDSQIPRTTTNGAFPWHAFLSPRPLCAHRCNRFR